MFTALGVDLMVAPSNAAMFLYSSNKPSPERERELYFCVRTFVDFKAGGVVVFPGQIVVVLALAFAEPFAHFFRRGPT